MRYEKNIIMLIAITTVFSSSLELIRASGERQSESILINSIISMPYAIFYGEGLPVHDLSDFDNKDSEEVKKIIRSDIENVIDLKNIGVEVYWDHEYVERIIRSEFSDIYPIISQQVDADDKDMEVQKNLLFTARASGSKNVNNEITYQSGIWKLHVAHSFTFSWDNSNNITISNKSIYVYSDSTPVLSKNSSVWHNGQKDATISFLYSFSGDVAMTGTSSYIVQYVPFAGGNYRKDVLHAG